MYVSPEAWTQLVKTKADKLQLDEWQALEREYHPQTFPDLDEQMKQEDRQKLAEGAEEKSPRGHKK